MDEITPENVQEKINLFQQMQQQSQALTQQVSQIDVTIAETERTLNELKGATKKNTIYRAIGSVMKKIVDVKKLKKELSEEKETMEIRNKTLKNQVSTLNTQIEELQKKLTPVVQSIQNTNQNATK